MDIVPFAETSIWVLFTYSKFPKILSIQFRLNIGRNDSIGDATFFRLKTAGYRSENE
jgi:hypothetical protein